MNRTNKGEVIVKFKNKTIITNDASPVIVDIVVTGDFNGFWSRITG